MYGNSTDVMRSGVIRLLTKQRQELLEQLLRTPDLLRSQRQDQQQRNLNREDIEQWLDILKGEAYKVDRLEVTFAVVGTMKAGKSTTINAIVGTEVLPNRNQPMTTLPTVIRHVPGKREPELIFPNPGPLNELIGKLRAELTAKQENDELEKVVFGATEAGRELVAKIIDGSLAGMRQNYKGSEEIFAFLKGLNDIWRLGHSGGLETDIEAYLAEYDELYDFPAIEVEFFHLRDQAGAENQGRFTLIDTPGPNEAGQTFLKHIVRDQLEQASAVLAVLDYTQLNAEADAEMRRSLEEFSGLSDDRLFILVNKFDQKDRHGMDVNELGSFVVKNLFQGRLPKERVHPVSSKYGYLANRALGELSLNGRLPDVKDNPWVEDFGRLALGACWESEIEDAEEVKYRAGKLWKSSLFDKPLNDVIKRGSENAAAISLKSAIAKMLDYDRKIVEGLQVRQRAITTDIRLIEDHIKSLEEDVSLVKDGRADARRKIDESIKALDIRIKELFSRCQEVAKQEVQSIFSCAQSNNWLTRRLTGFIDLAPKKPLTINFDAKGYNDFETEIEAKLFLNKLIDAVAGYIEPVLTEMQRTVQQAVDEMAEDIWDSVNRRLSKVIKTAEDRLNESFSLTLDFPKPQVKSVNVDFARLRQGAVKEGTVTRTGVKYERRWYTLWCRNHEATYQYEETVYRIYTMEIAKQLQKMLEEDHDQIGAILERYVQEEFGKALNTHFTDIANYLERFRGDLLDSKRDRELETGKLEKLQEAMSDLYKMAVSHRQEVELVAEGRLEGIDDRAEAADLPVGLRLIG